MPTRHASCLLIAALLCGGCGRTIVWPADQPVTEICGNALDDDGDGLIDCRDADCAADPSCTTAQEICDNKIDDDGDHFIDCQDLDCADSSACQSTPEVCDNNIDDDGDELVDCNDPECFTFWTCLEHPEDCSNQKDDDGDGLADCNDPQCYADPACAARKEICDNKIDDDGDHFIDCQDLDCANSSACQSTPEVCDNNIDDDGDELVDCNDPECFTDAGCLEWPEDCDNQRDDDLDGFVDCEDPQCFADAACQSAREICNNGRDDDRDGATDCDDPDCTLDPACAAKQERCSNKIDDDGDYLVDCEDPDCFKDLSCKVPGQEICNNGLDDDEDSFIDCRDPDCSSLPLCQPGQEVCDNQKDDDRDGAVDCDDPDCKSFPACIGLLCHPTVSFGSLQPAGSSSTRTLTTSGTQDIYTSGCAVRGGGEVVATFTLSGKTDLKLAYRQQSGDHSFALFRAGLAEACNANPRGCYDPESAKEGAFSIKALEAGAYYLIAEAFAPGLEGAVAVTLSTAAAGKREVCDNGADDDGDLAIDCADIDCFLQPICTNQVCKPDVNLGTLVVDGPAKTASINTSTSPDRYTLNCAAGGGGDRVIRVVLPTAAILAVTVEQEGWHAQGLHKNMGPGTTCNADEGTCSQKQWTNFVTEYGTQERGEYFYIVDAMNGESEGQVSLSFQAYSNRGPELCQNGVDDDADGFVDCDDPDCTGVLGCSGPLCIADYKTGPLVPTGAPVTISLDTSRHNNDQTLSCALGGGKDAVIEVDLPQVSALEVNCEQSGDHLLGLFTPGGSREPCDKNEESCADPTIGPIACHFYWTNLQPGKYYIIVEAFKPGAEGPVTLSLQAHEDYVQEICDNGIDDDGDGKTDCQDYNCSSKPICEGATCTPDLKLDILPPGGTTVNAAATTVGAGDTEATSCARGGGEDYVVGFTLAKAANLELNFAQFGNHVFAVYGDKGQGYACDAAPVACQPSNNQALGKVTFRNLAAGQYYLVVEAVAAGSEGSVVMQLTAK